MTRETPARPAAALHAQAVEVLERISDAFYAVDRDWRFTYVNGKAEQWWRRKREDLLGKVYWDEFPAAIGSKPYEAHFTAVQEQRAVHLEAVSPILGHWVDISIYPSESGLFVYFRDITARKRDEEARQRFAEEMERRVAERTHELAEANARLSEEITERERAQVALMQGQRLEAIGQLTGGVAHDFNNLLTAVIGNLELMRPRVSDERLRARLDGALKAARRGGELTQQLLAYARRQRIETAPVDVNAEIAGMRELLARTLGGLVDIETDLQAGLWHALSDPAQLESVILNLAINARDAMPNGGRLRIGTRNLPAGAAGLPDDLPEGDYVLIRVQDEGSGMPPEIMARAFEPFFTTKDIGKGSGLGLAQVQGLARQFGGTVRLSSTVGVGTEVELFLPRAQDAARASVTEPGDTPPAPPGGVRILVVDDEEEVRAVTAAFLAEAGYRVRQAPNGAAALAALDEQPAELALVDQAMATMPGTEFVQRARQRWPDLKVIYVTGNAEALHRGGADRRDPVLPKPYRPEHLLAAVRSARERRAAG